MALTDTKSGRNLFLGSSLVASTPGCMHIEDNRRRMHTRARFCILPHLVIRAYPHPFSSDEILVEYPPTTETETQAAAALKRGATNEFPTPLSLLLLLFKRAAYTIHTFYLGFTYQCIHTVVKLSLDPDTDTDFLERQRSWELLGKRASRKLDWDRRKFEKLNNHQIR